MFAWQKSRLRFLVRTVASGPLSETNLALCATRNHDHQWHIAMASREIVVYRFLRELAFVITVFFSILQFRN
ncbi:hypothetical protein WN51_07779 [Melipona quadrifasciata]|uniref:Uncharacterized protein n=1 Tax=Melipona quadrifasciata TaxID=166423 RepID=A0A0N0BJ20_9HYME|nr:hypothetical protein WN51_07779 [Melipona quadrifasciata]